MQDAIDAVVLWVDGSDPGHRAKLEQYLATIGRRPDAARPTRFLSVGEIDHCIRSILRFAPYVRRIHVVTDDQTPEIFKRAMDWEPAMRDRLVLVDHREIFAGFESYLPTFNSLAIESVIHRIPGLSEHFVYFNDDFMLIKPVEASGFFRAGRPVLHGRFDTLPELQRTRRLRAWWRRLVRTPPESLRASNREAQALGARLAGADRRFLLVGHNPYPLRRSLIERFFADHPDMLERNVSYRLRDGAQFAPTSLGHHLALQADAAIVEPDDRCLYLKPASRARMLQRMEKARHQPKTTFACIQSLDEAPPDTQRAVTDWLVQVIGQDPAATPTPA